MDSNNDPGSGTVFKRIIYTIARWIVTPFLILFGDFHPVKYRPKAKTFILAANHVQKSDHWHEMICVGRYMRSVPADQPETITACVRAGVSVAVHPEGAVSLTGETGHVPGQIGQIVKDSGAALVTVRNTGGYLRTPRWAKTKRKGPAFTKAVAEYSPEELAGLTAEEITGIIRRDIYVNVYAAQREDPHDYTGKNLCEELERALFVCPQCESADSMRSRGDTFSCAKCGYSVGMDARGFFTDTGSGLAVDNIVAWDRAQKHIWRQQVESAPAGKIITEERGQKVYRTGRDGKRVLLSSDAVLRLYPDSFWIILGGKKGSVTIPFDGIGDVLSVSDTGLVIINDPDRYEILSDCPRCAGKYVAAWSWLTGRDYF